LLLELANAISAAATPTGRSPASKGSRLGASPEDSAPAKRIGTDKTVVEHLATMPELLAMLLTSLEDYILSLGDDVQRKELKLYIAYTGARATWRSRLPARPIWIWPSR